MDVPEKLREIAKQVEDGHEPEDTPRALLSWFDFRKRSSGNAWVINQALRYLKLATEPDYQYAYVDSLVKFIPLVEAEKDEKRKTATPDTPSSQETPIPPAGQVLADPTYRVGKLTSANKEVISVKPDASVKEAVTLMLARQFSQLPVMTSPYEVKGIISWKSIGTRTMLKKPCNLVRECMDKHHEISSDLSLFQAIELIVAHEAVLVRDNKRKISGIITASDLSETFNQLAAPFLFLQQIENHIRRLIDGKFSPAELAQVRDPADTQRQINSVHDLAFGEYIKLIEKPENWIKLGNQLDRATFIRDLESVRRIRNDAMHFDPEGIDNDELATLRGFLSFVDRLHEIENS